MAVFALDERADTQRDGNLDPDGQGFLDRTGELGEPEIAARVLLDAVEGMIRQGERRPLMLSNKTIDVYQRFKSERHLVLIS